MNPATLQFVIVAAVIILALLVLLGFAVAFVQYRSVAERDEEIRRWRDLYTNMVGERDEARSWAKYAQDQLDRNLAATAVTVPRTGPTSLPALMAPQEPEDDEPMLPGTGAVEAVYVHERPSTGPHKVQQAQVVQQPEVNLLKAAKVHKANPAPAVVSARPAAVKQLTLVQLRRAVRRHDKGEAWAPIAADLGVATSTLARQVAKAGDRL